MNQDFSKRAKKTLNKVLEEEFLDISGDADLLVRSQGVPDGDLGPTVYGDITMLWFEEKLDIVSDITEITALIHQAIDDYISILLKHGLISDEKLGYVSDAMKDDLAAAIVESGFIIATLKQDYAVRTLTSVTPLDTDSDAPFEAATRMMYDTNLDNIMVHPAGLLLAHIWTTAIQVYGAERGSGYKGNYIFPTLKYKMASELATVVSDLRARDEAMRLAEILGCDFIPLPVKECKIIDVVSLYSDHACMLMNHLPARDDAGSSLPDVEEDDEYYYLQFLGGGWELFCSPLLRRTESTVVPGFITSRGAPAANKLSAQYGSTKNTTWTAYPDTDAGLDLFQHVATRRSSTWVGPIGTNSGYRMYRAAPVFHSEGQWNNACARVIALGMTGRYPKSNSLVPVLEDQVTIQMRDCTQLVTKYSTEDPPLNIDPSIVLKHIQELQGIYASLDKLIDTLEVKAGKAK